jgi:hypothetical protein
VLHGCSQYLTPICWVREFGNGRFFGCATNIELDDVNIAEKRKDKTGEKHRNKVICVVFLDGDKYQWLMTKLECLGVHM